MQIEIIAPASADSTYLHRVGLGPFNIVWELKDIDLMGTSVDSKRAQRGLPIAR